MGITFITPWPSNLYRLLFMMIEENDCDDDEVPCLVEVENTLLDASITADNSLIKIPVTILVGFLGSGKSTLLNYILKSDHGKRIAVIENEFSEGLGIETMIAKSGVDGNNITNFFELPNGCICCTIKNDLLSTLEQLVSYKHKFDYLIIETTGMANPGPVISTFWTDAGLDSPLQLDGVVCVVDALHIDEYLDDETIKDGVRLQICYADRIMVNKVDLVSSEKVSKVRNEIQEINSYADIRESSFGEVNLDYVLSIGAYAQDSLPGNLPLCSPCESTVVNPARLKLDSSSSVNHIPSDIRSHSIKFPGQLNLKKLQNALDSLLYANGLVQQAMSNQSGHCGESEGAAAGRIYRAKGLVHVAGDSFVHILQAVHDIFDITPSSFREGSAEDSTGGFNLFILIGKRLDANAIEKRLVHCLENICSDTIN